MLLFHDVLPVDQPVRPLAGDYRHGDSEPDHYHNCAQLIHSLSGVVQVTTRLGSWWCHPAAASGYRRKWCTACASPAVAAVTLFVDPLARADLPAQCRGAGFTAAARVDYLCDGDCARLSERRAR